MVWALGGVLLSPNSLDTCSVGDEDVLFLKIGDWRRICDASMSEAMYDDLMWLVGVLGAFTCPSEDSEEEEEDSLVSCWTRDPSVVLSMLLSSTMLRLWGEENDTSLKGTDTKPRLEKELTYVTPSVGSTKTGWKKDLRRTANSLTKLSNTEWSGTFCSDCTYNLLRLLNLELLLQRRVKTIKQPGKTY